jgi:TolB-like protein/predicted TPR repeat methyltransferase
MRNLSGDPEQDYLVDGMTEALITDLSRISELKVASRSSAMRYKGSDKPLSEVARELNVDAIVEGSVAREGDRVAVTAQLIEAATETNLWADRYEREISSIMALQADVARAIAREIQVTLTPQEEALLASSREVDPEAYEAYLKGMAQFYELTPAGLEAAQHYFEQALEKDPNYAQAHGGLALVWGGRQQMGLTPVAEATPKAKAAAQRALEIDDSVAEAHYALAVIRAWSDWDWDGAEPAFQRAIELKPNWADVRAYYSHYLLITGRTEEAIAQMEQAVEIDPYNALVRVFNGVVLENTGRCEEALGFYRSTLEAAPNNPVAMGGIVRAYYCLEDYEQTYKSAVALWAARGRPEAVAALENGYTEGGFEGAMSALADWLEETATDIEPCGSASVELAWAGRTEEALDCLELLFEAHHPHMPYIGVNAIYTVPSLRNEPRLQELLRQMELPDSYPPSI